MGLAGDGAGYAAASTAAAATMSGTWSSLPPSPPPQPPLPSALPSPPLLLSGLPNLLTRLLAPLRPDPRLLSLLRPPSRPVAPPPPPSPPLRFVQSSPETSFVSLSPALATVVPTSAVAAPANDADTGAGAASSTPATISKEDLGRATWTLLHLMAAQYPEEPTKAQKRAARQLIEALAQVYPCGECAAHFAEVLRQEPPVRSVNSRSELVRYVCDVHNIVNRSLDKPDFDCSLAPLRWGRLSCEESACDLQGLGSELSQTASDAAAHSSAKVASSGAVATAKASFDPGASWPPGRA